MMKRNYWPLFFIGIFSFAFSMIIWTIYSASKVPINKDETFLSTYHDVDTNYNKYIASNNNFEKNFDFKIKVNKKEFSLVFKDMFLGQRVIERESKHKDIFLLGNNQLTVEVKDKNTLKTLNNVNISLRISRPTNHNNTMDFKTEDFKNLEGKYVLNTNLPLKGNWNITGQVKVNDNIGYFYIKSNAI